MKLVFLGTGGSYPSPARNVSGMAVKFQDKTYLFDCGEGTQRQLMRSSLSFMEVDKVFITHFHGDHFLGVPGLIQSMNMNERERALEIYGPPGTEKLTDILSRIGYFNPGFDIDVQDLEPRASLSFDKSHISTVTAHHTVPAMAYCMKEKDKTGRFDKQKALELGIPEGPLFSRIQKGESVTVDDKKIEPDQILGPPRRGKKIVFTGDTKPSPDIESLAREADALVHDGTLDPSLSDKAFSFGHTPVDLAAQIARRARVKRLFLVHISPRYDDISPLEKEARDIFEDTIIPSDLDEFTI